MSVVGLTTIREIGDSDVCKLGYFFVNICNLLRELTDMAHYKYLCLLHFGVYSQHGSNCEGACLSRSVLALSNQVDVFSVLVFAGDHGDGDTLNDRG